MSPKISRSVREEPGSRLPPPPAPTSSDGFGLRFRMNMMIIIRIRNLLLSKERRQNAAKTTAVLVSNQMRRGGRSLPRDAVSFIRAVVFCFLALRRFSPDDKANLSARFFLSSITCYAGSPLSPSNRSRSENHRMLKCCRLHYNNSTGGKRAGFLFFVKAKPRRFWITTEKTFHNSTTLRCKLMIFRLNTECEYNQ